MLANIGTVAGQRCKELAHRLRVACAERRYCVRGPANDLARTLGQAGLLRNRSRSERAVMSWRFSRFRREVLPVERHQCVCARLGTAAASTCRTLASQVMSRNQVRRSQSTRRGSTEPAPHRRRHVEPPASLLIADLRQVAFDFVQDRIRPQQLEQLGLSEPQQSGRQPDRDQARTRPAARCDALPGCHVVHRVSDRLHPVVSPRRCRRRVRAMADRRRRLLSAW